MANKRDVQLIVRAKDEASRAIDAVAGSISKLLDRQTAAGAKAGVVAGQFGEMAAALADVEKANGLVAGATDRAESVFKRQSATLAETRAQLQSTRAQIENVAKAVAAAQTRLVDTSLAGGDTSPMIAQIAGAEAALRTLIATEGRLTASVKTQEGALGQQRSSLQQLSSIANTTEAALASLGNETERAALKATAALEAETRALRDQAVAARDAANAQRAGERFAGFMGVTENPGGRTAAASASVFQEMQANADAAQRLRDRMDPLAAIQRKLNGELATARGLYKQGALSALELASAETVLAREADDARAALDRVGKGANGKIGFMGLKPYELTNLGYQANDIVTQLASGTAPMQVLAQQGGQVLQLLPNIGTKLVSIFTNPIMLGGIATIGGLAILLSKASDESDRMRKITGMLVSIADGAKYSAAELNLTAKALQKIGLSADDALNQVRAFVTQGLNPSYLMAFSQAALDLAMVTGKELPEAAEELRVAFAGGYDAIAKLDDAHQFLTATEREQIRVMFESGRAAEGRATAFRIFSASQRDGAKAAKESQDAIESLTGAVSSFLGALANTSVVQGFAASIRDTFKDLARDIRLIGDTATLDDIDTRIEELRKKKLDSKSGFGIPLFNIVNNAMWDQQLKELQTKRVEAQKKYDQATGDTVDENSPDRVKARQAALAEIELERKLALTTDDREKARLAGIKAFNDEMAKTGDIIIANARKQAAVDIALEAARKRNKDSVSLRDSVGESLVTTASKYQGMSEGNKRDANTLESFFKAQGVTLDPEKLAWCAAFLNSVLSANGLPSTGSNMARSFQNYGTATDKPQKGDIVVFKDLAGNDATKGHVGLYMGPGAKGKIKVLGGNQGKSGQGKVSVAEFNERDVIAYRRASGEIGNEAKREQQRFEDQEKFNDKLDDEAEKRRLITAYMAEQMMLSGDALLEAKKRQSIDEAVLAAQQDAAKKNITLDAERLKTIRDTVAAEWDIANAREKAAATVNDSSGERAALMQQLDTARQLGDTSQMAVLETEIKRVETALSAAIDKAIAFWKAFDTPEARTAIAGLENLKSNINLDDQKRQRQTFEQPMDQLQSQRSGLMEQIQYFREVGQMNVAEELRNQLRQTDAELLKLIDTSLAWWNTNNGPEAQAAITNLQNMRNQIVASQNEFSISAGQIQGMFAGSLADSVKLFAQRLVETKDPIRALGEAAISFAASFMEKIADAILQILALKVAMKLGFGGMASGINGLISSGPLVAAGATLSGAGAALTASGAALGTAGTLWMATAAQIQAAAAALLVANTVGAATGGVLHSGGIAGSATRSRAVSPAWFRSATRYHSGGVAGLRPNEVPAILERGEEVITKSDVRHRMNGGMESGGVRGSGAGGNFPTQILAIGEDEIVRATAGAAGRDVFITRVRREKETIRQILRD